MRASWSKSLILNIQISACLRLQRLHHPGRIPGPGQPFCPDQLRPVPEGVGVVDGPHHLYQHELVRSIRVSHRTMPHILHSATSGCVLSLSPYSGLCDRPYRPMTTWMRLYDELRQKFWNLHGSAWRSLASWVRSDFKARAWVHHCPQCTLLNAPCGGACDPSPTLAHHMGVQDLQASMAKSLALQTWPGHQIPRNQTWDTASWIPPELQPPASGSEVATLGHGTTRSWRAGGCYGCGLQACCTIATRLGEPGFECCCS